MATAKPTHTGGSPGSVCFIHTSPAMVHMLDPSGADAMGGAELQMYLVGRELRRRGWDVSYVIGDYNRGVPGSIGGCRVEVARGTGCNGTRAAAARALPGFWRALARADADTYVTLGLTAQTGVTALFAQTHGKSSVFRFGKNSDAIFAVPRRSGLPVAQRLPAWYGMTRASSIVCQTSRQIELLRQHVGRDGVLIRGVTPWQGSERSHGAGGPVLWVGSMQPKKRPEMMLDVAQQLPEVEFVVVGGPMKSHEALYERVSTRAASLPNVRFLGFVPHSEIRKHFLDADMLLSTSDGDHEGFPNVFLEAWTVGLPVVATCDPDGLIDEHGLGKACGSVRDIVQTIRGLRERQEAREGLSDRVQTYIARHHSAGGVADIWERLLTDLATTPQTSTAMAGSGRRHRTA